MCSHMSLEERTEEECFSVSGSLEAQSQASLGLRSLQVIVTGHAAAGGRNPHLFWCWDRNYLTGLDARPALLTFEYFSGQGVLALNNAYFIFLRVLTCAALSKKQTLNNHWRTC